MTTSASPSAVRRGGLDAWRAAPAALRWLPLAAAVSLTLHLRAVHAGAAWQVFVFKPLTTTLILAMALAAPGAVSPRYRRAVAAGLVLSLVGDVVLILPGETFVYGLGAFLVAHVLYLIAFTDGVGVRLRHGATAAYVVVGGGILAALWSRLDALALPVAAYVAVILAMAAQAAGRAGVLRTSGSRAAAAGAVFFVISDATLAIERFGGGGIPAGTIVIMTTYIAAQLLIAASVADRGD